VETSGHRQTAKGVVQFSGADFCTRCRVLISAPGAATRCPAEVARFPFEDLSPTGAIFRRIAKLWTDPRVGGLGRTGQMNGHLCQGEGSTVESRSPLSLMGSRPPE
jgi:hypothetical protein